MDEKNLENSSEELTEVQETGSEQTESAADIQAEVSEAGAAEETTGQTAEQVSDQAETAEETAEQVSDQAETAEETAEQVSDQAESPEEVSGEAADAEGGSETIEIVDPTRLKGTAPNSVPVEVKKGKKPLNRTNIVVIVICAIIVVACLIFVGFKVGWFDFLSKNSNKINLADLSEIQVQKDLENTDDDSVDYYIETILSGAAETEELTEGKVGDGDTVSIDYVGILDGETEPFEGGSAEGYELEIGSGTFIDGFEDGLVGKSVGDKVDLNLTFPEDYSNEDVAGKDVTFTVTINHIDRTTTPELTDEWVQEYSAENCPETYQTVDEFKEYIRGVINDYYINNAIYEYIEPRSEVVSYDTDQEEALTEYANESLSYSAQMYGYDVDSIAEMYGYSSAEEYNTHQAHDWQKTIMIIQEICKRNNITYDEAELDDSIEQYMKEQGYAEYYSLDEFKEQSGETWLMLYTNLEFLYNKALDSLHDNVVFVDEVETVSTTAEETEAVEEDSDEVDEDAEDADSEDIEEIEIDGDEDAEIVIDEDGEEIEIETEAEAETTAASETTAAAN